MKNKNLQASYTVEASLVMPILIFIIMTLMYMAFYLHDISRVKGILDKSAMKACLIIKHEGTFITGEANYANINERGIFFNLTANLEKERRVTNCYVKDKLSKGLIIVQINGIEVEANHNEVNIKVVVKMKIPFEQIKKYITGNGYRFCIETKTLVHNPAEFIWSFDGLVDAATKVKGSDEAINRLKVAIEKFR